MPFRVVVKRNEVFACFVGFNPFFFLFSRSGVGSTSHWGDWGWGGGAGVVGRGQIRLLRIDRGSESFERNVCVVQELLNMSPTVT